MTRLCGEESVVAVNPGWPRAKPPPRPPGPAFRAARRGQPTRFHAARRDGASSAGVDLWAAGDRTGAGLPRSWTTRAVSWRHPAAGTHGSGRPRRCAGFRGTAGREASASPRSQTQKAPCRRPPKSGANRVRRGPTSGGWPTGPGPRSSTKQTMGRRFERVYETGPVFRGRKPPRQPPGTGRSTNCSDAELGFIPRTNRGVWRCSGHELAGMTAAWAGDPRGRRRAGWMKDHIPGPGAGSRWVHFRRGRLASSGGGGPPDEPETSRPAGTSGAGRPGGRARARHEVRSGRRGLNPMSKRAPFYTIPQPGDEGRASERRTALPAARSW